MPTPGINSGAPGEFISPRQATGAQNMEATRGVIRKRFGTDGMGDSLGERVMAKRELLIGQLSSLVRVGLTKTEKWNTTTEDWDDIAHAAWTGTVNDRFDFAFPLIGGVKHMVITNGVDEMRKYAGSGTTAALGGSPPKAKFILDFKDFMLAANITDDGSGDDFPFRVQWPDSGDPENWTIGGASLAGFADLAEDGLDVTGLGRLGEYATVHKESAIYLGYRVGTSSIFQFERKSTGAGAVSHETIKNLPGETEMQAFLSRDGIRLFNGISAPLVQSPIMDEIREQLSPEHAHKSTAIVVRELDEYWVAMPLGGATEPETIFKYNYRLGYAWKDTRANLTCMATFQKTSAVAWDDAPGTWNTNPDRWNDVSNQALNPTPVFGFSDGTSTQRLSNASDNGAAIDAYMDSKDFTCQDFGIDDDGRMMRWLGVEAWAKGDAVTLYYSVDGGESWTVVETKTLTSVYPSDDAPCIFYFDVVSTRLRLRWRNNTDEQSFTLKNFTIGAVPREMRR